MQEAPFKLIITVLSASLFLCLLVAAVFLLYRIFLKRKNALIVENKQLKAAHERRLIQAQLDIQEHTFNKISEEIHDNIGQKLSLVRLQLNALQSAQLEEKIAVTDALLETAISELRSLSHNLNSNYIRDVGLEEALRQLLQYIERTGLCKVEFQPDNEWKLDEERSVVLYRIIQELIQNTIKHAHASLISLAMFAEGKQLFIKLKDNGCGFDTSLTGKGIGLENVFSRARIIEANVQISSSPNSGTTISIQLPETI